MPSLPCALAIGGLDPGGGAGIAADLRAFVAAGVFGCAVVAVVTVQSTRGMRRARAIAAAEVAEQAEEVLQHQRVRAVKVGALGSAANVEVVTRLAATHPKVPFVVDTPMLPTRGRGRLLGDRATAVLREKLLPQTTLLTVNADEAGALLGEPVHTVSEAHDAARALARMGARAVLVKGGHFDGPNAIDILVVDGEVVEIRARRLSVGPIHGTGCTLASLIAGRLAARSTARVRREDLVTAIRWAKRAHHAALAGAVEVGGGMKVLVF